jgi:hypothetical protein
MYTCEICKYTTKRKGNMITHKSSKKHKQREEKSNIEFKHYCETCNYKTDSLYQYKRHIEGKKHKQNTEKDNSIDIIIDDNSDSEEEDKSKANTSVNETQGLKITEEMFCELMHCNKQLMEVIQNGINHITNNNINNNNNNNTNTFNLDFFLNETCKDAMNMKDFIGSIEVSIMDLKKLGNKGYVEGISNLMINKLNELDITKRPIHCTDVKRNSIYIKDGDVWEKDETEKLMSMLWDVARLETQALENKYKIEYPKCETDRNSREHEEYWRIFYNAMGGKGGDIKDLQKKVIKKIAQHVAIDKTKLY